jgi:hypothetical protein
MDTEAWRSRTGEIHSKFFRPGLYTHLWIDPDTSSGTLKWRYQFMDLGMCHVIEREYRLEEISLHDSEQEQLSFVFCGHYGHYIKALYAEFL